MRLTGEGVTDDAPYRENEYSSRDIRVSSELNILFRSAGMRGFAVLPHCDDQ